MDSDHALKALSALSHPARLAAYRQLVEAGREGMSVGALREVLLLPPATLSAHLNVLRAAGLVVDQREGRSIRVSAAIEHMNALIGFLSDHCCGGDGSCAPKVRPGRQIKKPRRGITA